jgi:hypothetical protein
MRGVLQKTTTTTTTMAFWRCGVHFALCHGVATLFQFVYCVDKKNIDKLPPGRRLDGIYPTLTLL